MNIALGVPAEPGQLAPKRVVELQRTDIFRMFVSSTLGQTDREDAAELRDTFCSHCMARTHHELHAIGELRASRYSCTGCQGQTCRCANFSSCAGAAIGGLMWDEALCVPCQKSVAEFCGAPALYSAAERDAGPDGVCIVREYYVCVCVCICVCWCLCVCCVCICVCVSVCSYLCVYMSARACLCLVCRSLCLSVSLSVCSCVGVSVPVSASVTACRYAYKRSNTPPHKHTSANTHAGWSVLAHILLPPGLDGGTQLSKKREQSSDPVQRPSAQIHDVFFDAEHVPAHQHASPPRLSNTPRKQPPSPTKFQKKSPTNSLTPPKVPLCRALPNVPPTTFGGEGGGEGVTDDHAHSRARILETVHALKSAMQVTSPVAVVPPIVVAGASTTDLEPWLYIREALLSWPGQERANIDKYRGMLCHEAWIKRWLFACGGDVVWAMQRVLTHLAWRQEYNVDC